MINWPWQYEPIDLENYIPDFVITFKPGPLLVEVKPVFFLEEMQPAAKKITATSWRHEAMVVGTADPCGYGLSVLFGEHWERPGELELFWADGQFFRCRDCNEVSVLSVPGHFRCRRCGAYDGDHHVMQWDPLPSWRHAGNIVQWKATG